jgi:hypothetical protein
LEELSYTTPEESWRKMSPLGAGRPRTGRDEDERGLAEALAMSTARARRRKVERMGTTRGGGEDQTEGDEEELM